MGIWALGGPFWVGEQPLGHGTSDDAISRDAVRAALEQGATLFDTAHVHGTGHAEELLGATLENTDLAPLSADAVRRIDNLLDR